MPADDLLTKALNIRLTPAELDQIEQLRTRLQEQLGPTVRVTQRTVILTALERLEAHLAKLEKDRTRRASGGRSEDS